MNFGFRRLVLTVGLAACCSAASNPTLHIRSFDEVNDHLYRGGVPSPTGLQELAAMHVSTVIDLREPGEGTSVEERTVKALGMKYINIPMRPFSAPTQEQIDRVLSLLEDGDSERIFVHCRRGKDRTGTVIACYRIEHDRWDNRGALAEARKHGLSFEELGMRSFILEFTRSGPSALAKAAQ